MAGGRRVFATNMLTVTKPVRDTTTLHDFQFHYSYKCQRPKPQAAVKSLSVCVGGLGIEAEPLLNNTSHW